MSLTSTASPPNPSGPRASNGCILVLPACVRFGGPVSMSGRTIMNIASRDATNIAIPFDQARVDRAMDDAGLDVLLASSKHNVQYLLGGYKFIFFSAMEAIGHSRYLPVLIYEKGHPEHAGY